MKCFPEDSRRELFDAVCTCLSHSERRHHCIDEFSDFRSEPA